MVKVLEFQPQHQLTERLNNNNTEFKYILKQYVVKCSLIIRNHNVESIILTMWWYTITLKDLHILESDYNYDVILD